MDTEYEDGFLKLIALLSSGLDKEVVKRQLRLSDELFRDRVRVAYEKLKRVSDLSEEAASAIIWPRRYATAPGLKYLPRFSGPAVTTERARTLDAFHDTCEAVRDACQDMDAIALTDLFDWIHGWRPASHNVTPEIRPALEAEGADVSLYVWPEGLRLEWMKGHVNSIDLRMIRKEPRQGVISGRLLHDVRDTASGYICHEGATVAVYLPPDDQDAWREYLVRHGTGKERMRVRMSKNGADSNLLFNPADC